MSDPLTPEQLAEIRALAVRVVTPMNWSLGEANRCIELLPAAWAEIDRLNAALSASLEYQGQMEADARKYAMEAAHANVDAKNIAWAAGRQHEKLKKAREEIKRLEAQLKAARNKIVELDAQLVTAQTENARLRAALPAEPEPSVASATNIADVPLSGSVTWSPVGFLEQRAAGQMICTSCGNFSSAVTCWACCQRLIDKSDSVTTMECPLPPEPDEEQTNEMQTYNAAYNAGAADMKRRAIEIIYHHIERTTAYQSLPGVRAACRELKPCASEEAMTTPERDEDGCRSKVYDIIDACTIAGRVGWLSLVDQICKLIAAREKAARIAVLEEAAAAECVRCRKGIPIGISVSDACIGGRFGHLIDGIAVPCYALQIWALIEKEKSA